MRHPTIPNSISGWESVSLRITHQNLATHLRRERWICNNRGMVLTRIIHWLGPQLFTVVIRTRASKLEWETFKGPYQKNTPLVVKLEPVIYRLQVQTFLPTEQS